MSDLSDQQYWWGFSRQHGWVVLDRSVSNNRHGLRGKLSFFRCGDSEFYDCDFKEWVDPEYIWAQNYLKKQPNEREAFESLRVTTEQHLKFLEIKRDEAVQEAKRKRLIKNHKAFLKKIGRSYQGVVRRDESKARRVTHCYSCQKKLDNSIDSECASCRWIICECGACGCGYVRYKDH